MLIHASTQEVPKLRLLLSADLVVGDSSSSPPLSAPRRRVPVTRGHGSTVGYYNNRCELWQRYMGKRQILYM